MAKQARVKFSWTPSVSPDVVSQFLDVNGEVMELAPLVAEFTKDIPEKTVVHAELYATDGTNDSDVVTLDFDTGDLTAPLSPTNFAFTVTDIIDV